MCKLVHMLVTAAQFIKSMCGPDIIDFITEAAGRMKFDHGPHLAPGPDFGHVWFKQSMQDFLSVLVHFIS